MKENRADNPMNAANSTPRCGARNRQGNPCQCPAMRGKRRCRIHGGKSPGPPKGNRNAWKHGIYSAEAKQERRAILDEIREMKKFIASIEGRLEV